MKVSRNWLQKYFDTPLPNMEALADAFTFHAFEIEETKGDMLDVKVLPNRAADCLSHRGIAKEISAILDIPLKNDPLRQTVPMYDLGGPTSLTVAIEDPKKCLRYMGALVKGVKVRPSPEWLREALESVGQRSINNIVDATNYVMLNTGQPLHAFDAAKLAQKDGKYSISVRGAKSGEKMTTLSGEEFTLNPNILLITDANADTAIGIAGVKGGKAAQVTENTTDIIIESANFDGTTVRRGAQTLKLFTDASMRFQNRPSPELVVYGMRDVLALITEIAGGEVVGVVDEYPVRPKQNREVSVSLAKVNGVLGADFSQGEVEKVFKRLALPYMVVNDIFTVTPPFERIDLTIPEDLVEEVGRIIGYDKISATELPPISGTPDQARYRGIERMKDQLIEQGFTEVSTQSFATTGDIYLANPLDKAKPALRTSLKENMKEALERAKYVAPLVLAPNQKPKLFEVGTIFTKEGEELSIETSEPASVSPKIQDDASYEPKQYRLGAYKMFSIYPFIVRDIAFWVSSGEGETPPGPDAEAPKMEELIRAHAGSLLARISLLDRFSKEGRISYAFRLVFQSVEKTLTDVEVNEIMETISGALSQIGHEVR